MHRETTAVLVGAASVMDLTGRTVSRYTRTLGVTDAEEHADLIARVRRGQWAMFVFTISVLTSAVVLALLGAVVAGGVTAIVWVVLSLAVSAYGGLVLP